MRMMICKFYILAAKYGNAETTNEILNAKFFIQNIKNSNNDKNTKLKMMSVLRLFLSEILFMNESIILYQ